MRDRGLRQAHALFDISGTQARTAVRLPRWLGVGLAITQSLQDFSARRIGNGVKRAVERCIGGHDGLGITRESMVVNLCPAHVAPDTFVRGLASLAGRTLRLRSGQAASAPTRAISSRLGCSLLR